MVSIVTVMSVMGMVVTMTLVLVLVLVMVVLVAIVVVVAVAGVWVVVVVVVEAGFLLVLVLALHLASAGQRGPQLGAAEHQPLLRHHPTARQATRHISQLNLCLGFAIITRDVLCCG